MGVDPEQVFNGKDDRAGFASRQGFTLSATTIPTLSTIITSSPISKALPGPVMVRKMMA